MAFVKSNTQRDDPTASPVVEIRVSASGNTVALKGNWNLRGFAVAPTDLRTKLRSYADEPRLEWDLREVEALDSAGAFILWQAWGEQLPGQLHLNTEQKSTFARWQQRRIPSMTDAHPPSVSLSSRIYLVLYGLVTSHVLPIMALLGQFVWDLAHVAAHPRDIPWREISATIHETGTRALGITALVGFLIGIVLSYLSSLQLQTFGAQIYIVNILGMSIIRELGPLLTAILVAGRSGSAMTARIGVMSVTQELDALAAMGISHSLRLILPRVVALTITMPLLVVWTDAIALAGGATSANLELGIGYYQFFVQLPDAVPVANFAIGVAKAVVFGFFIAFIACHFGLRIEPNTESLGSQTTNSVVTSITLVIIVDAVFAVIFRNVGLG